MGGLAAVERAGRLLDRQAAARAGFRDLGRILELVPGSLCAQRPHDRPRPDLPDRAAAFFRVTRPGQAMPAAAAYLRDPDGNRLE